MEEIENVLSIFKGVRTALENNDTYKIKTLSGQVIHTATISQDPDNILVSVLVYAIGKILERDYYKQMGGWDNFHKLFIKKWDEAIVALKSKNIEKFRLVVGEIRDSLNSVDVKLAEYVGDIFRKAEINKSFKLYEHGLSAEQTAKLLGVSLWDLASYIGQSTISESSISESLPVKTRIKYAEEIFS